MIKSQTYGISSQLLNYDLLTSYIERFWTDVFSPLVLDNSDKHLMLLVKVSFGEANLDCAYKTLGYLKNVNHSEKEDYTDYLAGRLAYLNESYISDPINKINFSYIEKEGLAPEDDRRLLQDVSDSELTFHRFNNMLLPVTMKLVVRGSSI